MNAFPSAQLTAHGPVNAAIQRPPPGHIGRSALQQRLLAADCRLRLLIAPAGFGKTVLLADCARHAPAGCNVLWLNGAGLTREQLAQQLAGALGYVSTDADQLLAQVAQETRRWWIFLNDYPAQPNQAVDHYLEQLLSHSSDALGWWLGSRRRPLCNLSRLLLEGDLLEMGASDLAFIEAEVGLWLAQLQTANPAWASRLYQQTQGWPAALRLKWLAAQSEGVEAEHEHLLLEYVEREVLHNLPQELRSVLCQLAQLTQFNPLLCEHLFGVGEGAQWLRELLERGVFIQEIDGSKGWLQLFRPLATLLQQHHKTSSTLHVYASQWFASQGDLRNALEHALLAGQPEVAGSFLERFTEAQVLEGQSLPLILRWRSELPQSLLYSTPRLILQSAWVLLLLGRLDEAQQCIDQLARFQPRSDAPRTRELFAHWQAVQGIIAFGRVCAADTRSHLLEALQNLPPSAWAQALMCRSVLTLVAIGEGNLEQAQKLSYEALRQARGYSNAVFEALLELDHALLLECRGEFARAEALLLRVLDSSSGALANIPALARVQLRLGRLQLRQGRCAEAAEQLRIGLAGALSFGDPMAFHGYLGQAELAMVQGDIGAAFACLAEAERLMQRQHVCEPLYRGTLLLASSHLWISQGHYARAREAATRVLSYKQKVKAILPTPNFPELIPRLEMLLLQLDLLQGVDVREGVQQLLNQVLSQGRQALACELWLLLGRACAAQGDSHNAEQAQATGEALRERLGYVCLWFSLGGVEPAEHSQTPGTDEHGLSGRELAVLRLIAQGLSNQEVAEQLFISLHTVKTHARRINGKLGVARRTQAVAKAKELGVL
ncbi:LuxR C-terminal-related transcriptional regulator [Pseudomonas sp. 5P_3.1_Bac2]|uniref:LuxR C-terminal-related transcriptional regulator n=1 Tax=Pseudomonas sp. 5P_3.1_Bac2 TaxID=2971617 RepID=UPI0021C86770|nr:LuxR C-terminal-related transcriptional regulator [Pseudomonas sp. 5P_3.1_Bac2]MCU1715729.1 LuxR C-terminal-related transcriptional regulator [Pseudomonas sp. 5P_3.1_Bac2]